VGAVLHGLAPQYSGSGLVISATSPTSFGWQQPSGSASSQVHNRRQPTGLSWNDLPDDVTLPSRYPAFVSD